MLVYLLVYAFMQLGAFAVVVMLRRGRHRRRAEGPERPARAHPPGRLCDAAVHAVAGRHSADRGLHGQVLALRRGDRLGLHLAGGHRRAQQRAISLYYYVRIVVFMYLRRTTPRVDASAAAGAWRARSSSRWPRRSCWASTRGSCSSSPRPRRARWEPVTAVLTPSADDVNARHADSGRPRCEIAGGQPSCARRGPRGGLAASAKSDAICPGWRGLRGSVRVAIGLASA